MEPKYNNITEKLYAALFACSQVYADASLVFPLMVAETFALHADKLTAGKKTD